MVKNLSYTLRLTVLLSVMSEHTMSFMLPTILIYYIENLLNRAGESKPSLENLSYHVGMLEGSYGFCALLGGTLWGVISDKIGRKLSMMIILSGVAVSSIGLGLATSFEEALFWRILAGCFAGIIPTIKILMRDISNDSNISVLYSYFGAGYGASSIFGPLLGGFFSRPNDFLPDSLHIDFFDAFPYFLPLFIHSLVAVTTLALVICVVPSRTHISEQSKRKSFEFLKSKDYLSSTMVLLLSIFVQYTYRTLISLLIRLDVDKGGMGWKIPEYPGIMNMLSGIISMLFPLTCTNVIRHKFGIRTTCLYLAIWIIFPNTLISFASKLPPVAMWIVLVVCNGFIIAFCTVFLSIISIAVSNSVHGAMAGTAIGLSQAGVAGSRASATAGTAMMFGFLQSLRLDFPFDSHFIFFLNNGYLLITIAAILCCLTKQIEKRIETHDEESLLKDYDSLGKSSS